VLEIKYIKKGDGSSAAVLKAKQDQAREQIAKYRASHLFKDRTDVRYLIILFIGKEQVRIEEIA
jgi:Holliday junction resolvase-like predicted endonuclease